MRLSTGILKSNVAMKQGYLYIKRERNSDRATSRVFSKPWQRAYFILRRDPYILEEYKDASLHVIRQIHIVSIIKHVGRVRTSRSKQYAFEVVLDGKGNKGSLQLACDNQILLDEWVKLFVSVMEKRKAQMGLIESYKGTHGTRDKYMCNIEMVETILSSINDLHGEYVLVISNTRMSLLDPESYTEVLSWPLHQVANYYAQRNFNRIVLVMGRNSHFGSGKLIIESKDFIQVNTQLNNYIERKKIWNSLNSPERTPTHDETHQSQSSKSKISDYEMKLRNSSNAEGSLANIPLEEFQRVRRLSNPETGASNKVELRRLKSYPDSMNHTFNQFSIRLSDTIVPENIHIRVGHSAKDKVSDEGYIQPNEIPEDDRRRFERFARERTSIVGRPLSANESETSTSYLQLLDEEDQVPKLLDTITSHLENPQRKVVVTEKCPEKSRKASTPVISHSSHKKVENRRSSEPLQKAHLIERISGRENSLKCELTSLCSKKQASPRSSPKQQPVRMDGLPKQNSISVRSEAKGNLFSLAASSLINNRSPFQSAETFLSGPIPNSLPFIQRKSGVHNSRPTSRDMDSNVTVSVDEPPPLPRRESPELLQWRQQQLSLLAGNAEWVDEVGKTGKSASREDSTITRSASADNSETREQNPPPLPPKLRPVSLPKLSTLTESIDLSEEISFRRSFQGVEPSKENGPTNENKNSDEKPPSVPKRDYTIRTLVKQNRINGGDDSLLSIPEYSLKKLKRPSPLGLKPPKSKSLESLAISKEFLTCPVVSNGRDVSPPLNRRTSTISEGEADVDEILLDGEGQNFPSISLTKLSNLPIE